MENRQLGDAVVEESTGVSLSDKEKIEYLVYAHRQLVKLLTLIEEERKGEGSARNFFGGFLFDLSSADELFGNKFSLVLVKLNGLYRDRAYLSLEYQTVRNKIFESRGVIEGIAKDSGYGDIFRKRR